MEAQLEILPTTPSHTALCKLGAAWVEKEYSCTAFTELVTMAGEIPDVFAFCSSGSTVLIEVKVSRSDYKADIRKRHRLNPNMGMGKIRYYLTPKDMISSDELPENWGLLYEDKGKIIMAKESRWFENRDVLNEGRFLYSILKRVEKAYKNYKEVIRTVYN